MHQLKNEIKISMTKMNVLPTLHLIDNGIQSMIIKNTINLFHKTPRQPSDKDIKSMIIGNAVNVFHKNCPVGNGN